MANDGPKPHQDPLPDDGTHVVEFMTAEGDVVIQHFQEWFNPVDFGACSVKSRIIALI